VCDGFEDGVVSLFDESELGQKADALVGMGEMGRI
jgi:hypothetical protein